MAKADSITVTTVESKYDFDSNPGFVTLSNNSSTETVFFGFGLPVGEIAIGKGIMLAPGASFALESDRTFPGNFSAIATGSALVSIYFNGL